jgi:streptomycin 6-kinase
VIEVPQAVRAKAQVHGAQQWLDDLPSLVSTLEREWSLTVGRAYPDATEAFVAGVVCADGTPAVLKLMVPRSEHRSEERARSAAQRN